MKDIVKDIKFQMGLTSFYLELYNLGYGLKTEESSN